MIDLTPIINAAIMLISAVITAFVIPWIKGKIDAQKLSKIMNWVKIAVNAAEQIYTEAKMGEKKKEYVLNFLASKGYTLDPEKIDAMIESAVYELKK